MKYLALLFTMFSTCAMAGVSNPPNIPLPANPSGWCTATQLVPGTVRTTQIGDCPQAPPTSCPAGRVVSGRVAWTYSGSNSANMDLRYAGNIFGKAGASDPAVDFPWKSVFGIVWAFPRDPNAYIAAGFQASLGPLNQFTILNHLVTSGGPPLDVTISKNCGDFNPPDTRCKLFNVPRGQNLVAIKLPGYAGPALCPVEPGQHYFVNIRLSGPGQVAPDCTNTTCKVGIQNNHTP